MKDEQNAKKLNAGNIDLWATGDILGPELAKAAGVKIKPILTFKQIELYSACNLAMPDADVAKMNDSIKTIKSDGTYKKSHEGLRVKQQSPGETGGLRVCAAPSG